MKLYSHRIGLELFVQRIIDGVILSPGHFSTCEKTKNLFSSFFRDPHAAALHGRNRLRERSQNMQSQLSGTESDDGIAGKRSESGNISTAEGSKD
jgi:hypothetical protein